MIDSAQKKIIDENSLIETPKKIIPPRIEIIPAIENISKNSPPTITQPLASNDLSQLGTSAHRFSFNQKKHGTHKKLQKKNSQKLDKNNSSLPLNIPLSWKSLSQWQKSEGIPVDMVIRQGRAEQQKNYLSNLYGSLVLPKVYLGSRLAATDKDWLEEHNITHILTVADGLRPAFPKEYTYKVIQVRDSQNQNLLEHFDSCHRFIDKTLSQEKGNLLIHCQAGISRSASVLTAYIMKSQMMEYEKALELVRSKRSIVWVPVSTAPLSRPRLQSTKKAIKVLDICISNMEESNS